MATDSDREGNPDGKYGMNAAVASPCRLAIADLMRSTPVMGSFPFM
jgi:hypothetical protein